MMDIAVSLFAFFIVWLLGALFLRAMGLREKEASFLRTVPVDFCIGSGLLFILLFTTSIATGLFRPWLIYLATAALAAMNLYGKKGRKGLLLRLPNRNEIICMTLILAMLSLVLLPSMRIGLDGDGWAIWAFKAKAFFKDGRIDFSFLSDMERYAYSHPDYPLLIPTLEYWVYIHLGHINDHVIKIVPITFWVLMLSFLYSTLLERVKTYHAALGTSLLALCWPINENMVLGMIDGVQAFYNLAGLVYIFRWLENEDRKELLTSALLLGFGANVKNEGVGFWIATLLVLVMFSIYKVFKNSSYDRLFGAIKFSLTGMAIILPWAIEKKINQIGSELFSKGFPPAGLIVERIGKLAMHYLSEAVNIGFSGWGLLWIFMALAIIKMIYCSYLKEEKYQMYLLICVIYFLILAGVYIITPYDLKYHLRTSGNRTLLQIVPAVFWIGMVAAFSRPRGKNEIPNKSI